MEPKNADSCENPCQGSWVGILVLALAGCVGVVHPPGSNGGGSSTGGSSTDAGIIPGDANGATVNLCLNTSAGSPFPVPLQRINAAQYGSIVSQLFGATIVVPSAFPAPLSGYPYTTFSGANPMGEGQSQGVLEAGEAVAIQVADLVPVCSSTAAETTCATTYLTNLALRAFRRPATSDELKAVLLTYSHARTTMSYQESVAIGVETILQMPQFLYVLEEQPTTAQAPPTTLTGLEMAQRMALLYWNGLPDQALMDAAQSGALADPSNRLSQAQRMMQDPRAHAVFSDFLRQWMTIKDTAPSYPF